MRRQILFGTMAFSVLLAAAPLSAHHAFSSEFDADKPLQLAGAVSQTEWVNPHAWIHIQVKGATGMEEWMVEGGTPNTLMRRGVTRDTLKIGTEVKVSGYQAKDGSNRVNGRDITYPDGRKLFLGSTGTGAPYDTTNKEKP
jgi:Family of unknown function (DUF6152)